MSEPPAKPPHIVRVPNFQKPTTGNKGVDRSINEAVDDAMLILVPFIRDTIRREIKKRLEACE